MYKDILVHLTSDPHGDEVLKVATGLAAKFGARLTGLFAQSEQDRAGLVARRPSDHYTAAAEAAAAAFNAVTEEVGLPSRFWRLSHGEYSHVVSETVFASRYFDLVVMGQRPAQDARVPEELMEQVALNSGGPVLFVPHAGAFPSVGARPVVAWNGSREAARALRDALPLLARAQEVVVLSVRNASVAEPPAGEPRPDIEGFLGTHGIAARYEKLAAEDIGTMDLLLSRAFDYGSDLLVMGAHAGYGLEFLRGSGTKYMLRHMTMPLLMSH